MRYHQYLITILVSFVLPLSAQAAHHSECGDPAAPLLEVADYNGDGKVDGVDVSLLARHIGKGGSKHKAKGKGSYFALYDRNADGQLDKSDLVLTQQDIGKVSGDTDQRLAQMYQRFKHFQNVSGFDELFAMGYQPFGSVLAGHGQHWFNQPGLDATSGFKPADPYIAEGLNVLSDGSDISALFWGHGAIPLFKDASAANGLSTLDWPTPGGAWETERVQAFADLPPDFFPQTEDDRWHTHGGLCGTVQDLGSGPEWVVDQHLSFAECQALPNLVPFELNGRLINGWINIWMLHVWAFDLNPNGTYANTHPCIEPDGQSEEEINGDREVPLFFQHHG